MRWGGLQRLGLPCGGGWGRRGRAYSSRVSASLSPVMQGSEKIRPLPVQPLTLATLIVPHRKDSPRSPILILVFLGTLTPSGSQPFSFNSCIPTSRTLPKFLSSLKRLHRKGFKHLTGFLVQLNPVENWPIAGVEPLNPHHANWRDVDFGTVWDSLGLRASGFLEGFWYFVNLWKTPPPLFGRSHCL